MSFQLPESISAFLTEPAIRTATLALLEGKRERVPDDITWPELPGYYRAMAAAQRIKVDYAMASYDLWQAVWGDAVAGWSPLSPAIQAHSDWDSSVTIERCWDEGGLTRCFEKLRARPIWLSVEFDETGCSIGFADDRTQKVLLEQFPGWEIGVEPWIIWLSSTSIGAAEFNVSPLQKAANQLMNTLNQMP